MARTLNPDTGARVKPLGSGAPHADERHGHLHRHPRAAVAQPHKLGVSSPAASASAAITGRSSGRSHPPDIGTPSHPETRAHSAWGSPVLVSFLVLSWFRRCHHLLQGRHPGAGPLGTHPACSPEPRGRTHDHPSLGSCERPCRFRELAGLPGLVLVRSPDQLSPVLRKVQPEGDRLWSPAACRTTGW